MRTRLQENRLEEDLQRQGLEKMDRALEALRAQDANLGRLVELRFFGGHSLEESGAALGLSTGATSRLWAEAKHHFLSAFQGESEETPDRH